MPMVLPGCRMKPVVYVPGCPMTPDKYGIPEPEGEGADPAIIDLVLLPAIACDAFGNRVGFGAGCYDRFLKRTGAVKAAVIHDFQLLDRVPGEGHDVRMDYVITPSRVIDCTRRDSNGFF